MDPQTPGGGASLARARRRAAKSVLGAAAGAAFLAVFALSRQSYASHPKIRAQPLGAPQLFVDIVRRDVLQAGVVAPPQAPPAVETAVS